MYVLRGVANRERENPSGLDCLYYIYANKFWTNSQEWHLDDL